MIEVALTLDKYGDVRVGNSHVLSEERWSKRKADRASAAD